MLTENYIGKNEPQADEELISHAKEQKKDAKSELRTMYDAIMQASEEDLSQKINLSNGALLVCDKGSMPSKLAVESTVTSTDEPKAGYKDNIVGKNIFPFGTCKKLVPPPCVPVIAGTWLSFNEKDTINDKYSINMNSFLVCSAGKGIIVPITSGQGVANPLAEIYGGFVEGNIESIQEAELQLLIMAFGLYAQYKEYSKGFDGFKEFLESEKFQEFKNDILKDYQYSYGYTYGQGDVRFGTHRGIDITKATNKEQQLIFNFVAGKIIAVRRGDVEWENESNKNRGYSDVVVETCDYNGNKIYVHYTHLVIDDGIIEAAKETRKEEGKGLNNNEYVNLDNPIPVSPGDKLGYMSDVGYVSGPHLHIEMGNKISLQAQENNPKDGTVNPDSMSDFYLHAH